MICFLWVMALAVQPDVVLTDVTMKIPASNWRELDFTVERAPAEVELDFHVVSAGGAVRVVILSEHDLKRFSRKLDYEFLRTSSEQVSGKLPVSIREAGKYAALVLNESTAGPPVSLQMRVTSREWLQMPPNKQPAPRYLSPERRLATIIVSFFAFFAIVSWSSVRLLNAMRGHR